MAEEAAEPTHRWRTMWIIYGATSPEGLLARLMQIAGPPVDHIRVHTNPDDSITAIVMLQVAEPAEAATAIADVVHRMIAEGEIRLGGMATVVATA